MYHSVRDAFAKQPFNQDEAIATYKHLIRSMPRANQYLLLYVLDLLSVFARKSDKNLMTASNLAVIFRPGLISHPAHEMSPTEHDLSQRVLEFLIAQQDWFMLDIPPPPPNEPGSPHEWDEDLDMEGEEPVGGSWRVVEQRGPTVPPMTRRKTTDDSFEAPRGREGDLSPVNETPEDAAAAVTVTRRRTLPSGRRGGDDGPHRPKLLKKQKRSSSSQPKAKEDE